MWTAGGLGKASGPVCVTTALGRLHAQRIMSAIRRRFSAKHTRLNSPVTFESPRRLNCRKPSPRFILLECIELFQLEPDTENVRLFALIPVAIGGGDKGPIRQDFHARVGGVIALGIVLHAYNILSGMPGHDVIIGTDPAHPVAFKGPALGLVARRTTAEADE